MYVPTSGEKKVLFTASIKRTRDTNFQKILIDTWIFMNNCAVIYNRVNSAKQISIELSDNVGDVVIDS